jgi:hypothetical protein
VHKQGLGSILQATELKGRCIMMPQPLKELVTPGIDDSMIAEQLGAFCQLRAKNPTLLTLSVH